MPSKLILLFCHPSTFTPTIEDSLRRLEVMAGTGIGVRPAEALTVTNSEPSIETPIAAKGEVVCCPRARDNDLRFLTFNLNPEPVLRQRIEMKLRTRKSV